MSDTKSKQIAAETQKDASLQRVIKLLNEDCPRGECQQYLNKRGNLSVIKGLGITESSFTETRGQLHTNHRSSLAVNTLTVLQMILSNEHKKYF